jgi:ubiquinone/menaquinone biosynthesis C-methylase UbiE
MSLGQADTRNLYRKRARRYDRALWIYRAFGFRIDHYRRRTVQALALKPGDLVVDLGCGTGLNLPFIEAAVGSHGTIIGVDLTDAMLDAAHLRAKEAGWSNVQFVEADLAEYAFPDNCSAILSTLAITLVPEYDRVIESATRSLKPGGRLAILDFKRPDSWPEWLVRLAAWLNRPYGVSLDLASRHPWESIRRCLGQVTYQEFYFGALYLCAGKAQLRDQRAQGDVLE